MSLNLGAFAGSTIIGWLSNRFGLKKLILLFMLSAFFIMVGYGILTMSVVLMFLVIFLIGLTVPGRLQRILSGGRAGIFCRITRDRHWLGGGRGPNGSHPGSTAGRLSA